MTHIPIGESEGSDFANGSSGNTSDKRLGLTLTSKEDKSGLSKKEKKLLAKERLREKRRANSNALRSISGVFSSDESSSDAGINGELVVLGVAAKVTTLSAATAAQNLAVFLKKYSDWIRLSSMDEKSSQQQSKTLLNQTIHEARHLYESALHVRSTILPAHHPDVIATKFSLAELLDSPGVITFGTMTEDGATTTAGGEQADVLDGERANRLREEILNAYRVEEREEER